MHDCLPLLQSNQFPALKRATLDTLQVNLGYRCNQTCIHCHVNAGPNRKEMLQVDTMYEILDFMKRANISTLDLTGGAPEMNPLFYDFVRAAKAMNVRVIDRCNLTILLEEGYDGLASFLAEHRVEVVASLPCYLKENVDKQRGSGVFQASLEGLAKLNALGYGQEDSDLVLNLVYNPTGDFLPPAQQTLEDDYKEQLLTQYSIRFNHLFTITNVPIKRFGSWLISRNKFDHYMRTLKEAYRADNAQHVMCRSLISIDWEGYVYDCDFNQMLNIPLAGAKKDVHISQLAVNDLTGCPIAVLDHCYACTAGQGSSCSGAL